MRRARSVGPLDPWTEAVLAVIVIAVVAGAAGLVAWVGGCLASLLTGHGFGPSPGRVARRLVDGGSVGSLWPGVPLWLVATCAAVVGLSSAGLGVWAVDRWARAHPRREGFAGPAQFPALLPGRAGRTTARRLRPSLPERRPAPSDLGVPIGHLRRGGPLLRATWEDVVLAMCAPRSGKTTCLAIPAVLDAAGAVVATSNKADLWAHTATLRGRDTGEQVWTFDPQEITRAGQRFVWSALDGVATVADARRLAGHFVQEIRRSADRGDFWDRDAEDLLTGLLLAAALDGQPLAQVGAWLTSVSSVQPRNVLAAHGFTQLADVMASRSQGAHETREGVYATARAAAACLSDPQIMAWVTPRPGMALFDPAGFVRSRQTLYLVSKDGAGSAAPLVAAFADRIMLEAVRCAERSPGGRLDPPLVAVLDEAANICRITELPRLYSHLGSRGVVPLTILQSRAQGRRVWGEGGMAELYGASTIKVIGAGLDDQAFAEELSRLVGEHDVVVPTRSSGRGGAGASRTTRRERVMPADQVRAMPKFTGLLLVTGVRPALLRLVPWISGPRAGAIRSALDHS